MKVVYTTHQFLPDYWTGTEILAYSCARELMRRDHQVYLLTAYPGPNKNGGELFDSYEYEGIWVDRFYYSSKCPIRSKNPMRSEYNNPFYGEHFRRKLREIRPDLVHFFHLQRLSASPIEVVFDLKIPSIFTVTDFWLVCPTTQLMLPDSTLCSGPDKWMVNCFRHLALISRGAEFARALDRIPDRLLGLAIKLARYAKMNSRHAGLIRALVERPGCIRGLINHLDVVLVSTRYMAERLRSFGLEEKRICYTPFGIDRGVEGTIPNKGLERDLRVGFIGTLAFHKGAHVLLEAVRLLPPDLSLKVKVYGRIDEYPEYTERLKRAAEGDRRIEFCGTFPNRKMGEVFHDLDVLVVPSLWIENSPLIIYSAQAWSVPVIVTNLPGMSEVITDGENGFSFEKGDILGLSSIIERLCKHRQLVGQLSRQATKPKSIKAYVDELEDIYSNITSAARKKAIGA